MTWSKLAATYAAYRDESLEDLARVPEEYESAIPERKVGAVTGVDEVVFSRALLDGADAVAAVAAPITDVVDRAAAAYEPVPPPLIEPLNVLSLDAALGCSGVRDDDGDRHRRWVSAYADALARDPSRFSPGMREQAVLTAAGAGAAGATAALADGFVARTQPPFDGDAAALAAFLARAGASGDAEQAWHDFRDGFPALRLARRVSWVPLIWLSRAWFHVIGGAPVGEVVDLLRAEVLP